ncbi:MAG: hypothetical protein AAB893_00335 [Patescibacteria group bacterium]
MFQPFLASFTKIVVSSLFSFTNLILFFIELSFAAKIVRSLRLDQWFHPVTASVRFVISLLITIVVFVPINNYVLRYVQFLFGSGVPLAKFFTGIEFAVFIILLVGFYKKQA